MISKQPSHPQFEALCKQEHLRTLPAVNVRVSVRCAIEGERTSHPASEALELVVAWFSGVKGWLATGLILASVITLGFVTLQRIEDTTPGGHGHDDLFASFVENGDWSELL